MEYKNIMRNEMNNTGMVSFSLKSNICNLHYISIHASSLNNLDPLLFRQLFNSFTFAVLSTIFIALKQNSFGAFSFINVTNILSALRKETGVAFQKYSLTHILKNQQIDKPAV